MDELEFRRRAITHPSDRDPAFLAAAEASVANRKHLDEMKQLDRSLQRAMEVEVPAGLAERILLRREHGEQTHERRSARAPAIRPSLMERMPPPARVQPVSRRHRPPLPPQAGQRL